MSDGGIDYGRALRARVDEPNGDPRNTLSRAEIDEKARRLALYGGSIGREELNDLMPRLWAIAEQKAIGPLLREPALSA